MLAAIDAAEQQALAAPNTEIYVGFWELGAGGAEPLPPASALVEATMSLIMKRVLIVNCTRGLRSIYHYEAHSAYARHLS